MDHSANQSPQPVPLPVPEKMKNSGLGLMPIIPPTQHFLKCLDFPKVLSGTSRKCSVKRLCVLLLYYQFLRKKKIIIKVINWGSFKLTGMVLETLLFLTYINKKSFALFLYRFVLNITRWTIWHLQVCLILTSNLGCMGEAAESFPILVFFVVVVVLGNFPHHIAYFP